MWNIAASFQDASSVAVYALTKYSSYESGWWPCESLFDQQNVMKVSCLSLQDNYKSLEFFSLGHLECTLLGHSHLQPRCSQVKNWSPLEDACVVIVVNNLAKLLADGQG